MRGARAHGAQLRVWTHWAACRMRRRPAAMRSLPQPAMRRRGGGGMQRAWRAWGAQRMGACMPALKPHAAGMLWTGASRSTASGMRLLRSGARRCGTRGA